MLYFSKSKGVQTLQSYKGYRHCTNGSKPRKVFNRLILQENNLKTKVSVVISLCIKDYFKRKSGYERDSKMIESL